MKQDLTEHRSRFNWIKIVFNFYIILILAIIIIAYTDILPKEISEYVVDRTPYSGKLIPVDDNYINAIIIINQISFLTGGVFSIAAGIVLSIKRDIFEILGIFVANMIPRERKYWGLVFDNDTKRTIPFVPVRVYSNELGREANVSDIENLKITKQSITDLDGNYRIHIPVVKDYVIFAQASGYEPYIKNINSTYLNLSEQEIFEDIPLVRKDAKVRNVSSWFYFNRPFLSRFLLSYIYIGSIIGTLVGIFALINNPIIINFVFVFVYLVSIIWNSIILWDRRRGSAGKILNKEGNRPIKNAIVKVYSGENKSTSQLSDEIGLVKFEVAPGNYKIQVSAEGFGSIEAFMKINKDGFLIFDIKMERENRNIELNPDLLNPFK